ncbi:MAG: hypothetical protein G8345_00610 [Magnetococcales bacterium]|nr:hypothetical protein [Magnetococcales bacterium]NGZ25369.1 hypothetical protein [Magnetococcales bacterium]
MEYLNLIPIGALVYWVVTSFLAAKPHDQPDIYFQTVRIKTNRKGCNFFGVPYPDPES